MSDLAPPLAVSEWLNTDAPIHLGDLRGRVVLIEAFQMLCPGCVSHGLPQIVRARQVFDPADLAVLGLHSVFEHHAAQGTRTALEAFAHEYRLGFPIGVDAPSEDGPIPQTMAAYQLQGTPSLILIDRAGRLRVRHFGVVDDLALGAAVARLVAEPGAVEAAAGVSDPSPSPSLGVGCGPEGCAVGDV